MPSPDLLLPFSPREGRYFSLTLREYRYIMPESSATNSTTGLKSRVAQLQTDKQTTCLGTSMANTLKSQADNMRDRRRQHVKAEAMKAPVKIIFPLVFFIFPSLFIVTLVPSALSLMKNLGH